MSSSAVELSGQIDKLFQTAESGQRRLSRLQDVAQFLLADGLHLTALELHQELSERAAAAAASGGAAIYESGGQGSGKHDVADLHAFVENAEIFGGACVEGGGDGGGGGGDGGSGDGDTAAATPGLASDAATLLAAASSTPSPFGPAPDALHRALARRDAELHILEHRLRLEQTDLSEARDALRRERAAAISRPTVPEWGNNGGDDGSMDGDTKTGAGGGALPPATETEAECLDAMVFKWCLDRGYWQAATTLSEEYANANTAAKAEGECKASSRARGRTRARMQHHPVSVLGTFEPAFEELGLHIGRRAELLALYRARTQPVMPAFELERELDASNRRCDALEEELRELREAARAAAEQRAGQEHAQEQGHGPVPEQAQGQQSGGEGGLAESQALATATRRSSGGEAGAAALVFDVREVDGAVSNVAIGGSGHGGSDDVAHADVARLLEENADLLERLRHLKSTATADVGATDTTDSADVAKASAAAARRELHSLTDTAAVALQAALPHMATEARRACVPLAAALLRNHPSRARRRWLCQRLCLSMLPARELVTAGPQQLIMHALRSPQRADEVLSGIEHMLGSARLKAAAATPRRVLLVRALGEVAPLASAHDRTLDVLQKLARLCEPGLADGASAVRAAAVEAVATMLGGFHCPNGGRNSGMDAKDVGTGVGMQSSDAHLGPSLGAVQQQLWHAAGDDDGAVRDAARSILLPSMLAAAARADAAAGLLCAAGNSVCANSESGGTITQREHDTTHSLLLGEHGVLTFVLRVLRSGLSGGTGGSRSSALARVSLLQALCEVVPLLSLLVLASAPRAGPVQAATESEALKKFPHIVVHTVSHADIASGGGDGNGDNCNEDAQLFVPPPPHAHSSSRWAWLAAGVAPEECVGEAERAEAAEAAAGRAAAFEDDDGGSATAEVLADAEPDTDELIDEDSTEGCERALHRSHWAQRLDHDAVQGAALLAALLEGRTETHVPDLMRAAVESGGQLSDDESDFDSEDDSDDDGVGCATDAGSATLSNGAAAPTSAKGHVARRRQRHRPSTTAASHLRPFTAATAAAVAELRCSWPSLRFVIRQLSPLLLRIGSCQSTPTQARAAVAQLLRELGRPAPCGLGSAFAECVLQPMTLAAVGVDARLEPCAACLGVTPLALHKDSHSGDSGVLQCFAASHEILALPDEAPLRPAPSGLGNADGIGEHQLQLQLCGWRVDVSHATAAQHIREAWLLLRLHLLGTIGAFGSAPGARKALLRALVLRVADAGLGDGGDANTAWQREPQHLTDLIDGLCRGGGLLVPVLELLNAMADETVRTGAHSTAVARLVARLLRALVSMSCDDADAADDTAAAHSRSTSHKLVHGLQTLQLLPDAAVRRDCVAAFGDVAAYAHAPEAHQTLSMVFDSALDGAGAGVDDNAEEALAGVFEAFRAAMGACSDAFRRYAKAKAINYSTALAAAEGADAVGAEAHLRDQLVALGKEARRNLARRLYDMFAALREVDRSDDLSSWGIEEKEEVRRGVRLLVEAQLLQDHEAELARNLAREFGAGGGSNAIHGDGDGNTSIDATMMPAAAPVAGAGVADAETMGSMRSQPPRSRVAAAKHAVRGVLALRKKH